MFKCFTSLLDGLLITDRGVLPSLTLIINVSITLLVSSTFALCIFQLYCWTYANQVLLYVTVGFTYLSFLSPLILPALKPALPDINIATPALFSSVFVSYISSHPFTLNHFVSLQCVSSKQHIAGFCFFIQFDNSLPFNCIVWSVDINQVSTHLKELKRYSICSLTTAKLN